MSLRENSWTSFLRRLPGKNSRQAVKIFSTETKSSKLWAKTILPPLKPPPYQVLPILQKLIISYKIWHGYLIGLEKSSRYSLGIKIDGLFVETISLLFSASKKRDHKLIYLSRASDTFDLLKFMLQISWDIKVIDNKKYIALSRELETIGRMLGGWLKQTTR